MKNIFNSNITKSVIIAAACIIFAASCGEKEDENTKSSAAEILSFTVNEVPWNINGTNLTCTYPVEAREGYLTAEITVSPGATVNPKSGVAQNFFSDQGVVYRVTAEDGVTRKTYLAKATRTKNSSAVIVTFKVNDEEWNIDGSNITYNYPAETKEGVLTPVIKLASGATVNPESGVEQNFFAPEGVTYTVTSENGTVTETYTAKATRTKYSEAKITGFSVGGVAWAIDHGNDNGNGSIAYSFAAGKEAGNLTPEITPSPGATVTPASQTSQNFFAPGGVTYTVTSEDGVNTKKYVVSAKIKAIYLLDRTKMSGHPVGNDGPLNSDGNGADKLFDGLARSLGATTGAGLQNVSFGLWSPDGMPLYYTIDLGVEAVLGMFWIEPRGHSTYGRYAFGNSGGASAYDWNLWGTKYDFADPTTDYYKPADDPYWTEGQWKNDPKWINLGNYKYRRPSNPNATPENPGDRSGDAWNKDLEMAYAPPSISNPMNFSVPEKDPVQYIRWEFIQSWSDKEWVWMQEACFYEVVAE